MTASSHIGRRLRQRWDALLVSAGVGIAVALCASTAASVGWVAWRDHQVRETDALRRNTQGADHLRLVAADPLSRGDLAAAQSALDAAARTLEIGGWKLSLPDRRIIASSQPAEVTLKQLPARWEDPAAARGPDSAPAITIPGRGQVILEFTPGPVPAWWDSPSAWGVAGAGAMVVLAWLAMCRRAASRIAGVVHICDALRCDAGGEKSVEALKIDEHLGIEAIAWNGIITERDAARRRELDERAAKVLNAASAGEGPNTLGGLCDALWNGLLIIDSESRIAYCNGAAATLVNGKREDVVGRHADEIVTDPAILDVVRKAIAGGCRHRVVHEKAIDTPGAGPTTLKYSIKSLRKDDFGAAFVVIEDVTQQKVAEESRHSFAAQVTHELRTPLTNMRLYVETLLEDESNDPQLRAKCLNVVSTEVRRLERVVSDMLSVSEMEAGSIALRQDDVRVDALLEEIQADHVPMAQDKEISLHFDLPPKLPVIDGDRDKLSMALHNLLGNAIKYTPAGGDVRVIVTEENGQLAIMIKDNGIGIKPEEAELIFEKFYRAKDKRINGITGSGLGLAIARQVVRMHGGDITVSSQIDKGSTFTLTLPLARAQATRAAA